MRLLETMKIRVAHWHASTFVSFNLMIRNCGLLEFPCLGNLLSSRGKRSSPIIRCRLDRMVANEEWHAVFTHSTLEYLGMIRSDHRPIVATILEKMTSGRKQFWFDKRWIGTEGLMESITEGWKDNSGIFQHHFVEKIRNYRRNISRWRKKCPR